MQRRPTITEKTGLPLVARAMIARYGDRAAANAAHRARVLDDCGDRETSRYWELVRERIDQFGQPPGRRGRCFFDDEPYGLGDDSGPYLP